MKQSIVERVKRMRKCQKKLEKLMGELVDIQHDEIDAARRKRIIRMLGTTWLELKSWKRDLEIEEDIYYEAMEKYHAWEHGLCPEEMSHYSPRWPELNPVMIDTSEYEEIAKYLDGSGMSREGTRKAVEAWRKVKSTEPAK